MDRPKDEFFHKMDESPKGWESLQVHIVDGPPKKWVYVHKVDESPKCKTDYTSLPKKDE